MESEQPRRGLFDSFTFITYLESICYVPRTKVTVSQVLIPVDEMTQIITAENDRCSEEQ